MPILITKVKRVLRKSKRIYAAITADIVGSRDVSNFPRERDRKLKPLARQHLAARLIVSEYAVTAWDEFEGLTSPEHVPSILLDLRRYFYPFALWIGIGVGTVSEPHRTPINVFAGGEAFERARKAIDKIKKSRNKSSRATAFVSGKSDFDLIANTMYHLHDTLIQGISPKQWQTINAQLSLKTQGKTAKKLGLDTSSVSRTLRRGFYNQIEETRTTMEVLIKKHFYPAPKERS
jgi:hypothetical protein